ncbi:cell division protein FtsQ/DivIB [Patescibacteria group bacterium]
MSRNVLSSAKRKKRKRLFLRAFLLWLFVVLFLFGVIFFLFFLDNFKIKEVVFTGASSFWEKELGEIINKTLSAKTFFVIPNNRIFSFPANKTQTALLDKYSQLKSLRISRKFFSGLDVVVEERVPVAIICTELNEDKECSFLDRTGYIFEESPLFSPGVFVRFVDFRPIQPQIGENLLEENDFRDILNFKDKLADVFRVSEIYLKPEKVFELYPEKEGDQFEGWYLIFDSRDNLELLYDNLEVFLKEDVSRSLAEIEYVDLRFGNKIFFKNK